MNDQNNKLIRNILFSYAITFIIINLADSLTMFADGIVISRGLGAKALAATGLADPSYKIVSLFAGVLSTGVQVLCAQAMGSGDREKVNRVFSTGMIIAFAAIVILTSAGFLFTDTLCRLFGAGSDEEVFFHLRRYLKGWFIGIPGYILFYLLSPLATLDGNKKIVTAASFLLSGVNIAGDILSVLVLDAGSYGVGLSTGLSFNCAAIVLMLNFVRKQSVFQPFGASPDFRVLPKALNIGIPRITEHFCKILAPLIINRTIISIGGNLAMSAVSVKSSIMGFCVIIGGGIAESIGLLTQILYSEKDELSLMNTVRAGFGLLLTAGTVFSALLFLFAGKVAGLFFTSGSEELLFAVRAVRCLALSLPINGANKIIIKYLQGARKMLATHLMTSFHRIISLAVFTVLLGNLFGTSGLFAAIPVSEAAVLLGYTLFTLLSGSGKDFRGSFLMIPDGFGYHADNSCSFSISTLEDAVSVSEKVEAFCAGHGVSERTSYFSGLCMEELATNVVAHGFTKDDRKHYCDIRVMIDNDTVTLRIRDNCRYFNIRERYDSLTENDAESCLGIRLVYAIAKDVSYINILKTNTLIIRMQN